MKILICIKQVPDMESRFKINAAGTWYSDQDLAWRMNEYDEFAVEQAVKLREQLGEAEVVVLSVGPDKVKETMKKALAMGADRGVHIHDEASYEKDSFQIASAIAAYAGEQGFDAIFTGMQSQDRGSAQVGVLLAGLLGLPAVTTIVDFVCDGKTATVKRELEGGLKAVVKLPLPALFTCQLGLNTPRYPTLPNIMKAKKKELVSLPIADLHTAEAMTTTNLIRLPAKRGAGLILEGDISQLTEQLVAILKDKTAVLK
ncbi:MAG: electron transfer flavoprotein subunit beta/FixA family protein [Desulfuromonadales bacterium]|jgi:electron transfer flavoprotein beta subunit|nr:electron transfer flavoprotein subunit beta/FixA family protein [Desulfuromonadales bacterium]